MQKLNDEKIQAIKMNIDKLDSQQTEFPEKLREIQYLLHTQSDQIQNHLSNITSARYQSDHPNIPLNAKLKFLPVDSSGTVIDPPLALVDDQNIPISDELKLFRLPIASDRFQISNDQCELIIADENQIPISDPITFRPLTSATIEFEYVNDDQQSIRIIEVPSHMPVNQSIMLHVKSIPFDLSSTSEFQRHSPR